MKSFNVMLVFAAVGTAYAVVEDTRAGTTCKMMPANEDECRDAAKNSAMNGELRSIISPTQELEFYGSTSSVDGYSPPGCVFTKPFGSATTSANEMGFTWNTASDSSTACNDYIFRILYSAAHGGRHPECACVEENFSDVVASTVEASSEDAEPASSDIDCKHENCQEWTCKNWCHCYEEKFDETYAKAECIGDDTCNCGEMDNAPTTEFCYNFERKCDEHWKASSFDLSLFTLSQDACINNVCTVEQCCPAPDQ